MDYKWQLRKGGGKLICPMCGQKRFVPYVATADGRTIATDEKGDAIYGRCDRQDNCGYHLYPNHVSADGIQYVERKQEEPLRFVKAAVETDPNTMLFAYVAGLVGVARALKAWSDYRIGRDGERTVFWQIAKDGTVRAGKSIPYKSNGHRDKEDKYPAAWLHKAKRYDAMRTGTSLEQCFFGEHLLNERPNDKVVIVESEKTAAVMSTISSGWVWLASGGAQGLKNEEKNKALESREVWLLPDNGQYWSWREVAEKHGWKVFNQMELHPVFEGCDILDVVESGRMGKVIL